MMTISMRHTRCRQAAPGNLPRNLLQRLLGWMAAAFERGRQRRTLGTLSDHQLKDIGLTRADVARETAKPFWRV
ncbi:DUF1127 domain-containing protein [Dongia sp.]|uniref:DUF1127 domain-containing protein n=1 Tax=Dongia sp. TaxID=1977262 RepID=UPI0035AE8CEB